MPSMTITHIRRGFATNSSSTHSIMEMEQGQRLPVSFNAEWNEDEDHIAEEDFIAADRPSRIKYLHAMAADAARDAGDWRDEKGCYDRYLQLASVIPGKPLGQEEMNNARLNSLSGYAIPRKVHSTDMDVDFFERIVCILLSENIVIFGGPCGDPVRGENLDGQYVYLLNAMHVVSRRVSENEWTLLSLYDGTKYSVRFDDDGQTAAPVETARALEMVDVSITDSCTRQCSFCYRASEPGKPQADIENLKALVKGLKETDALETVIGGGEPTEHPDFYRFLKETNFGDLAVSFTTRDLDFIHSLAIANGVGESEVFDTIRSKVKAVGLSVRSAGEVKEAESNLAAFFKNDDWHRTDNPQMVFHVIPDTNWENLIDAIIEGKHSLLLLGMKFTGHNAGAFRKAYTDALDAMLKDDRIIRHVHDSFFRRRARLGVDTKFIIDAQAVNPDWLKQFHWKSWTDTEGARSVFIDLVGATMAPCSFGGKSVKLGGYDGSSLQRAFNSIEVYGPEAFQ